MTERPKKITDDPYGAAILIRRLVMEQGVAYWRRYLIAFALMGVAAGATAGSAYVLGQVINQAYIDKNVLGIAVLSGMLGVTLFGLFLTPVFFVTIESLRARFKRTESAPSPPPTTESSLGVAPTGHGPANA